MLGLAVKDLSPCAGLYKDKFTVLGNEVLQVSAGRSRVNSNDVYLSTFYLPTFNFTG